MHLSVSLQLCFLISWTANAFGQQGCNVTNKFGENCRYKCHCKADAACSQDGSCSGGCQIGWFGPACQYKDMAPSGVMDESWNETSKQNMHRFDWDILFKFTWMKLQFIEPVKGHSIIIISFMNQGTLQLCKKYIVTLIDDYTYNVHCDTLMFISSLTINTDSRSHLKEVYISGGFDGEMELQPGNTTMVWSNPSETGVEGSTNGYNCTSSLVNTTNADVNNKDIIVNHYMFSSLDGKDQLFRLVKYSNSEVYSFSDSGHLAFMYMSNNETVQLNTYNEIFFSVYTSGVILGLCEVHLFKEMHCTEIPKYIVDCNRRFNCLNQTEDCLFSIGQCPSGCPVGFTDECCTNAPCHHCSSSVNKI